MVAGVSAWLNHGWRIKNLEEWKLAHYHSDAEVLKNITLLREAVVKMEAIASGQERRIQLVEDRVEWRGDRHN
jgi:hypothetical protein